MSDLGTMIRRHYEDTAPPVDIEAIVDRMEARPVRSRARIHRGLAVAFAAAIMLLIAIGVPFLINSRSEAPVIESSLPTPTTTGPVPETTLPVPTTTLPSPTTSIVTPTTPAPAWTTFDSSDGAPGGTIHQVLAASDGSVWAIGDGGLGRFADGEWERVAYPSGFVSDPLVDLNRWPVHRDATVRAAAGAGGEIWFSHLGGVHRYLDGTWTAYPSPFVVHEQGLGTQPGPVSETMNPIGIGVIGDGSVWIATGLYVFTLDGDGWSLVDDQFSPTELQTEGLVAQEIVIGRDGSLWVSTWTRPGALLGYNGADVLTQPYTWETEYPKQVIGAGMAGEAWIVTGYAEPDRRLLRYLNGGWEEYPLGDAVDVTVAGDGTVWVAVTATPIDPCVGWCGPVEPVSEPGVYRFDGTDWIRYTVDDGLASNDVLSIATAEDGTIWFGTRAGISRLIPDAPDGGGHPVDW